ncbi:MAG: NADH-quinone oxidoreductase subunit J [Rhodospirillales bacterium]|nr:NADH-quinone oxidoreductase subunit J [Rhodospirillales bacterium]MCB9973215.1 NADH-quinone oxidoreductase subunit J [Rhodospirillales bacterium]MCB9979525.1 NADH-quinone oxidoreductase subunit J [Rhodospirillales bacterium]
MLAAIVFYLFAGVLTLSALMVITAKNPVHSVLFLILAFFNAAGLFILLGAEFIGMLLVIVYVGAVAVLFLFVVMMLNMDFSALRKGGMRYVPLGLLLGVVLLTELIMVYQTWQGHPALLKQELLGGADAAITNTEALGRVLYTDYIFVFQGAGMILLVAMIGAIVLTLRERPGVKRQKVAEQYARKASDVLEVKKVAPGTGV